MLRVLLVFFYCLCFFSVEVKAHIFSLYAGTNEEMKETIKISISQNRLLLEYNGEYHGQIAPHIRFMMDQNQDSLVAKNEINPFMQAYSLRWREWIQPEMVNINDLHFFFKFKHYQFPAIEKSKMPDPLFFTLSFEIDSFINVKDSHSSAQILKIEQRLLFQIGKQFIEMAKNRAAFTNEQENAIARFCQTRIKAMDMISFKKVYPGYISRDKREIYGIFFDDTRMRLQFLPYPQIIIEVGETSH
ncbi:hypothetical protein JW964_14075 [candidate division KSB1 bacterium]|nr:hypothetical protein [candidate division KSB1 bacterium]